MDVLLWIFAIVIVVGVIGLFFDIILTGLTVVGVAVWAIWSWLVSWMKRDYW